MGRWTLDYYDDVLGAKIKGLVDGAIKRSKLEKTEPTISYELFVEELDAGDSFTTSLIDILVKEMAERRTRPTSADRRLIADRSAKSLRQLATPLRIYRDRSGGHGAPARRPVHLTEYLTAPPDEMDMEEDDDEFDNMLGTAASAVEGARVNSEMYDAFGGSSHRWSAHPNLAMLRGSRTGYSTAVASTGSDDTQVVHDPPTAVSRSPPLPNRSPWLPSASSLFRQPSIRRPVRSRTVDFNDFTSRRRSSIRLGSTQEARSGTATEESGRSLSPWDPPPIQDQPPPSGRSPQLARRFFGFSRNRRHEPSGTFLLDGGAPENPSTDNPDEVSSYLAVEPSVSGPWFSNPPPSSSSSSQYQAYDPESSEERTQEAVPRLRRGGLRAPESLLSRHSSPTPEGDIINPPPAIVIPLSTSSVNENGHAGGTTEDHSSAIQS